MMLALLKKDWRLNRVVVVAALVMSTLPYVLAVANSALNPPRHRFAEQSDYIEAIQTAGVACLGLSVVLAAAFGGTAFAGERRERTAEFLGVLPAPRTAVILSKLIVAGVSILVLVTVHFTVLLAVAGWATRHGVRGPNEWAELSRALGMTLGLAVALFGMAWALSVYLRSPAISACIAIAIGFGLLLGGIAWLERIIEVVDDVRGTRTSEETLYVVLSLSAASAGLLAILATSLHYRRRVEP